MIGVVFSTGMRPGQLEVSPDLLTTHGFSSGRVLASCIRAAAWCCCCHGNCTVTTPSISSFSNAVNQQLSADAFCEKNYSQWAYFDDVIPTCFRGPVFFETQHSIFDTVLAGLPVTRSLATI